MLALFEQQSSLLSQNPAVVYIYSLAVGSRRTMKQSLNMIASMVAPGTDMISFPWHELRYQHTIAIRSLLQEKYAPATANKMLSALKRVLIEAKRLELIDVADCDRAIDLAPIKGNSPLRGRAIMGEEIKALVSSCDESVSSLRDLALISVLRVGLRRSEVVALNWGDIDLAEGSLNIKNSKGGKSRVVYLPNTAIDHLGRWLSEIQSGHHPYQKNSPVFRAISKSGNILNRRLSDQAVFTILKKRSQACDIQSFSPHDMRRTFVGDMLDAGVDIATVQQLAGHSSIETTSRYDRRGDKAKKSAVSKLQF